MIDRMALLERVAEGGREIAGQWLPGEMTEHDRATADYKDAYASMIELMRPLIHALDAHPAEPVGETVEVWGHARTDPKGFVGGHICRDEQDARRRAGEWGRTENGPIMGAVFSVRLPLPAIPTVAAKVET